MLKPQDIFLLMKIIVKGDEPWTQGAIAIELGMSASEVNAGIKRMEAAKLLHKKTNKLVPIKVAVEEFLIHAIKYVFPATRGEPTRGIATAGSAQIFKSERSSSEDPTPVWPDPEGPIKGYAFEPLYRSVPFAVKRDTKLHDLMAIVDVLRSGNAQDIKVARTLLKKELSTL